jgi:AraC family transcriptional regulator, positive regulator of tynA and feaB
MSRRRRLERARDELLVPGHIYTVSDVAARWQFSDASHFIRSFRHRYGETPRRFVSR